MKMKLLYSPIFLILLFIVGCKKEGSFELSKAATKTDLYPLSANSWWSYEDASGASSDTIKIESKARATFGGNAYIGLVTIDESGTEDTSYYRKAGNDYFEYTLVDNYTIVTFDTDKPGSILFLKEGLSTGTTWTSEEYSGLVSGQQVKLRYAFTCQSADVTETIGGKSYSNVYKILMKPQVALPISPAFADTGEEIESWFAKGVGMIYFKTSFSGQTFGEAQIKNYKVF